VCHTSQKVKEEGRWIQHLGEGPEGRIYVMLAFYWDTACQSQNPGSEAQGTKSLKNSTQLATTKIPPTGGIK
jgi:hypothetical protein